MDTSTVPARLIGAIFVEKGLITQEQLDIALEQQRATGERLGEILVVQFGVERLDLASALAEQWAEYERQGTSDEQASHASVRDLVAVSDEWSGEPAAPIQKRPIGEIFVDRGMITEAELDAALEEQQKSGRRLGEILVASGRLSRLDLASALADQWASFQKLRPPTGGPPENSALPAVGDVRPAPDVARDPAPPHVPAADLTGIHDRIEELAARVGQLPAHSDEWRQELEALAARIDALPTAPPDEWRDELAALAARIDALPSEPSGPHEEWQDRLADLAARIDALPAPSGEWRIELGQVADNLRTRLERVEQGVAAAATAEALERVDGRVAELAETPARLSELGTRVAELVSRLDALPAPTEEWRDAVESLTARVEELGARGKAVKELRTRVEELAGTVEGLPASADELRARVERAEQASAAAADRAALDAVRSGLDDLAARVDAIPAPSEEWRVELGQVAENLRTRVERVEQASASAVDGGALDELRSRLDELGGLAAHLDGVRAEVGELGARLAAQPAPSEGWRDDVAALAARLDALPVPSEEWRVELGQVAENLRTRVERVEERVGSAAPHDTLREVEARLDELAASAGRVGELQARVDELAAGFEHAPARDEEWRAELARLDETLRARLDRVEHDTASAVGHDALSEVERRLAELGDRIAAIPAPTDEWREATGSLAVRVEGLSERLAGVADARAEIEAVHERLAEVARAEEHRLDEIHERIGALQRRLDEQPVSTDEWRAEVAALAARIDALPAPIEDWRGEVEQLAESLRARMERTERSIATALETAGVDAVRARLDELEERVAAGEVVEERLHASLSESVSGRLGALRGDLDDVRAHLDESIRRVGAVEEIVGRVGETERRLGDGEATVAGLAARLDEIAGSVAGHGARLAEHAARLDDGAVSGQLDEALAALSARVDDVARGVAGHDERLHEHGAKLEDVAAVAELGGRIEGVAGQLADQAHRLEEHGARIDGLASHDTLAALSARVEEVVAAQASAPIPPELDARLAALEAAAGEARDRAATEAHDLRAALEDAQAGARAMVDDLAQALRAELADRPAGVSAEALDDVRAAVARTDARIGSLRDELGERVTAAERGAGDTGRLDTRLTELEAASVDVADEHRVALEGLRGEIMLRLDVIEREGARRAEIEKLRETVAGLEGRAGDHDDLERAATRATEEAVRDGLAALGARLTAAEAEFVEAGTVLRRSIEGLGLAIAGADAHMVAVDASSDPAAGIHAFVAFAPTAEGYRLVECDGRPPAVGDHVDVPGCDGPLVVTRIGGSPLPFDARRCVFVEPAHSVS